MDHRLEELESRIDEMTARLARIEERLERVEAGGGEPLQPARSGASLAPEVESFELPSFAGTLALVGRTFVILAGAFLLRVMTESGAVPYPVGVALGLCYAAAWIVLADRVAAKGRILAAGFYGTVTVVIATPLIFEATGKFPVLSPAAAALLLFLFTAADLLVAWRRSLGGLAWITTLAAVGGSLVLLFTTYRIEPFAAVLLLFGLATVWLGCERGWREMRWLTAVVVDVIVLQVTVLAAQRGAPPAWPDVTPGAGEAIAGALAVGYLGIFAFYTLARRRRVGAFEVLQTAVALVVGLGGAVRIAAAQGLGLTGIGVATLVAGAGCYAVAFAFAERRQSAGRNFHFYGSLALVLTLVGSRLLFSGWGLSLAWALLTVGAAALGGRFDRVTLRLHGAVYAIAGALQAGLVAAAFATFVRTFGETWRPAGPGAALTLIAAIIGYGVLVATRRDRTVPWRVLLPRVLIAAVGVMGVAAVVVLLAVTALAGLRDVAAIALVRSMVLIAAALALAWASRWATVRELGWLVYPILTVAGFKLLLEDLERGRALTLFIVFAAYGAALIAAPRLLRRPTRPSGENSG
jgi:hypothetical protein